MPLAQVDARGNPGLGPPRPQPDPTVVPPVIIPSPATIPPVTDFASLSFTASSYGALLPIVFGSDKVAGNVIWASAIRNVTLPVAANQPSSIQVVDFALALAEGEILGISRMWLGDRLVLDQTMTVDGDNIAQVNASGVIASTSVDLTDATGPLNTVNAAYRMTKITVFNGGENQIPREAMSTAEGFEGTPAYRGVAYILFENFLVSEQTIPNIFVELSSNTEVAVPRITGTLPVTQDLFTTLTATSLVVDVSHDAIYARGRDPGGTSPSVADADGYASFELNTLDLIAEYDVVETQTVPAIGMTRPLLLPSGKFLILGERSHNSEPVYTYNPFVGRIIDSFGSVNTGLSNSATNLVVCATGTSAMLAPSVYGVYFDTICALSSVGGHIALFQLDDRGTFLTGAPLALIDSAFSGSSPFSIGLHIDATFAATQPRFSDNVVTPGYHFYIFSFTSTSELEVGRVTVGSDTAGAAFTAADYTLVSTLDLTDLAGDATEYSQTVILLDPVDRCFVIAFRATATGATDVVGKFSPYTGEFVWSTPIPGDLFGDSGVPGHPAALSGQRWAFICADDSVVSLDLATGALTTEIDALGDVDLPTDFTAGQFYNGFENSITAIGTVTSDQTVVKFFLSRVTRQTIELEDVVMSLLERGGLEVQDVVLGDLSAVTLNGYTINSPKTLREALSELSQVFLFDVIESNGRVKVKLRGSASEKTLPHKWLAYLSEEGWLPETRNNDFTRVRKIVLSYRDIDREYAENTQSVVLPDYSELSFESDSSNDVKVPVVLDADTAKQLAEILLYAKVVYQTTYEMELPYRFLDLDPADVVTVERNDAGTETQLMRLRNVSSDETRIRVTATQEVPEIYTETVSLFGDTGRFNPSAFPNAGVRIDPLILQIPWRSYDELAHIFAAWYVPFVWLPWNAAATDLKQNTTATFNNWHILSAKPPSDEVYPTWGYVLDPLDARGSWYSVDDESQLRVKLKYEHADFPLANAASIDAMITNDKINLAYIEGELIQFATAVDEGDDVYLLTDIVRGKFGTDPLINTHESGGRFILLADSTGELNPSVTVKSLPTTSGTFFTVRLDTGVNDPRYPASNQLFKPMNYAPWSVHAFTAEYVSTDVEMSWVRRTRFGGEWDSDGTVVGGTVPLNEPTEEYTLYLMKDPTVFALEDTETYLRKVVQSATTYTYTAALQTADGFDRTTEDLYIYIAQTGGYYGMDGSGLTYLVEHL